MFTTIGTVSQQSPPSNPALRGWAYYKVFSFEPVATATLAGRNVKEWTFNVDAVRFFTTTTWEGARAYVRFINLPDSALAKINELHVNSSMFEKQNIPFPQWVTQNAEFVEIPNIKENLKQTMIIKVSLQESITEFKGIINGNFELGLENWTTWNPSQTDIDETIKKSGNRSLVTKRSATSGFVCVYQEAEVMEKTTYEIEA
jgi:hypothetical protein